MADRRTTARFTRRRVRAAWVLSCACCACDAAFAGDFADQVILFDPAPGQFINSTAYNIPQRALGAPIGGGTASPDNTKLVSLGGFGGSIILRFVPPVVDGPSNPYGLDAIVFGNASFVAGNPNRRFAEAGIIEISRDANANGLADDPWYLIRGSHTPALPALPLSVFQFQAWDVDGGTPTPPSNTAWYPAAPAFPAWPPSYSTGTFRLPALFEAAVLQNPLGTSATLEGTWGYADCTPTLLLGDTNGDNVVDQPSITPGEFFTSPDNPFAVGITPNSGGGDGVDISWAIDENTGQPARLASFDFIRISTGVNFLAGALGELSVEIGAVSRVRARPTFFDLTGDGRVDAEDLYRWHTIGADFTGETIVNDADRQLLSRCVRAAEITELGGQR